MTLMHQVTIYMIKTIKMETGVYNLLIKMKKKGSFKVIKNVFLFEKY